MYHIMIMNVLHRAAQLLHNRQSLHRREPSSHPHQEVFKRTGGHKRRDHVEQVLTFTKFEKWQDIWMIKLPNLFCFSHKIIAKRFLLSKARAVHFYRYFVVSVSILTGAVNVSQFPFTDTLQQEIIAEHDAFEIRHVTPRLRFVECQ